MISVLLVDDEPPSLDSGKRYLEAKGHFNVSTTLSPLTALQMLKSNHYDIIISDYNMPDMDGVGFLKEVRAAYPTLPFILYTSKSRTDIAGEAFDNEADFYLQRTGNPVLVMEELVQMIQLIVERRSMQEDLRLSEEKFHLIFDKAYDAIHLHELTPDGLPGRFLEVNEVACRMLQYSKDELLQKGPLDIVTGYYSRPLPQIMEDLALHGHARYETEHRRKDGTNVIVEVNANSILLHNKPVILSVVRDITERKRDELVLLKTTEELNQFFTVTLDLLCIADTDGYFRKLNKSWETTLGYSLDELMAHRFLDFVHPDDVKSTLGAIASLKNNQEVIDFENRYRCSDGSYRWIEWRSFPHGDLIYAAARDITDRKLVEDKLRKARDFYLKILDDFPNPIWRADVNAKCDYFNKDWLLFTGRSFEKELGDGWVEGVHPDDLERCVKIYLDNFHARKPFGMEYRLRYHDGTYHWLYDSGKPFYTLDGAFAGYIGSCYDIQDRKLAEDALVRVNKKLNLLSSITRHDINNQLMALNAYISLSEDAIGKPDELKEFIIKEQKIADAIANQISFTKDYENLGVKAPVWQNISAIIKKVIPRLPVGNIHIDADDPNLEVFADPLLEKVFYNLVDNALRYGGRQMTSIHVTTTKKDNEMLVITVKDDGNGISADDKKELFTRGFGKNTGLGLFLSREILSLTSITISETGEQGKGARFEILVPKGGYRFIG